MEAEMTELEKMKRAEMYIRKMAEGVNPLTDEGVSENDLVNNIRITRCLYYVSDILRQVIDKGGVIGKKSGRSQFYLTGEQREGLVPFERHVFVREIAEKLNEAAAENDCKKLVPQWITEYFVSMGLLEVVGGKKTATEAGEEFGIKTEIKYSPRIGEYRVNSYSPDAQRFIFDNIDAITDFAASEEYKEQIKRNKADTPLKDTNPVISYNED